MGIFNVNPTFIAQNAKEEMFWFEFDWNNVSFEWKQLDPSIASGTFLMNQRMKKKCNERNRADKANRNTQEQMKNVTKRTIEQRWLFDKLFKSDDEK